MINSTAAPITRSSGSRELFRATGADSGTRGVCGPAGAWPKVSGAGLANILVYSPGPCGAIFGAGVGNCGGAGRCVLNTCVALPEESGGGAAGAGAGGAEGMESRPKICVNSPAPLGAEGVGVSGAMCCAAPGAGGVIGDSKKRVNSPEDTLPGGAGAAGRCACSICVNSPG